MHDPLGFIENQMGGPNKHDTEIKDPWKSAEIIKKHVTEGLVMARKHLLPTAIQAFIPEHQGTMLIAYFHHQAQQMAQEDPSLTVDDADFRYDGPIPQSRETGIVMLADSCEAALRSLQASAKSVGEKRSLKDVSTEQALTMLNNILRAKWQDNQLVDSGLKREEMSQIAQIFVDVWQQFHHKRIAYPKLKASNTAAEFVMVMLKFCQSQYPLSRDASDFVEVVSRLYVNKLKNSQMTIDVRLTDGGGRKKTLQIQGKNRQVWIITQESTRELYDVDGIRIKEISVQNLIQIFNKRLYSDAL